MPTQNENFAVADNEAVSLVIGGKTHGAWEAYDIDSDLLIPADDWQCVIATGNVVMPENVKPGAEVQVRVGSDTVLTGRIDRISHIIRKGSHTYQLSGRDMAAQLVDCSAPVFVRKMATLEEIITSIVRPLGIKRIRLQTTSATATREKINVEPGDTAWEVLRNAAEANGLWPWFEPDGTLVVGGPDYTTPPVAVLICDPDRSNVESITRTDNIAERYSDITVLGQTHATHTEGGKNNLKGIAKDTGIDWPRPKIVIDHETDTTLLCEERAAKLMGDSRLKGFDLKVTVKGHRIYAPGEPGDGQLWKPGQRVRVFSTLLQLDGIFFVMGRKFLRSRGYGTTTELTLKEDGVWVVDAHPHKRKHRRGKNAFAGKIITFDNVQ